MSSTLVHSAKGQAYRQAGFTLIELLVVIAIIGILSSVVLASLNSARIKGRDARRISDVKQLQLALELYNDSNQSFPTAAQMYPSSGTSTLIANNYISSMPVDPTTAATYSYAGLQADGVTACTTAPCPGYVLGATIEGGASATPAGDIDTDFTSPGINCADPLFCVTP